MIRSELIQNWDNVANKLNQIPLRGEQIRYAMAVKPLLALPKSSLILEAGCGSGRILRILTALGYSDLIGLEISF
ncbi:MAG: class I SAM-dependent methyltransferase, partial [Desulfobacteraceae bacterium]